MRLGANYVGTEHILLALLREPDTLAITLLEDLGVDIQTLYEDIMLLLGESEAQPAGVQGMHERPKEEISETETLDKFSRDMTALAKQGKFDPIVGREQEIERIIRILSRRTKNNPCLMGTLSSPFFTASSVFLISLFIRAPPDPEAQPDSSSLTHSEALPAFP